MKELRPTVDEGGGRDLLEVGCLGWRPRPHRRRRFWETSQMVLASKIIEPLGGLLSSERLENRSRSFPSVSSDTH